MNRSRSIIRPPILAAISSASIAACACAQTLSVEYSLSATEVYTGTLTPVANPNGLIEPGESVLLQMTVSFSPPVGTIVSTPSGPGPIVGFGGMAAHVSMYPTFTPGTWSDMALAPGWSGQPGFVQTQSNFVGAISPWQFPPWTGSPVIPDNPIENIWRCVWTPQSYEQQLINFQAGSEIGGPEFGILLVHYGNDPTTGQPLYDRASIPNANASTPATWVAIIPAPGTAGLLFLSGLFACSRKRTEHCDPA